jgi:hypothetical protein
MATETPVRGGNRPRSWLLILLGVVVVGLIITRGLSYFSADGPAPPSNQRRPSRPAQGANAPVDPAELDVRLEDLKAARPERGEVERDPFRFKPVPPPPAPPPTEPPPEVSQAPIGPPLPPPVPTIPLKLMGFIELQGGFKLANLSDCKGTTWSVREGETVDGQYRIVKIGLESIVIEYINGKGRQTLPVAGCPPR